MAVSLRAIGWLHRKDLTVIRYQRFKCLLLPRFDLRGSAAIRPELGMKPTRYTQLSLVESDPLLSSVSEENAGT